MRWRSLGPIAIALGVAGCALDRAGAQGDGLDAAVFDATTVDAYSAIDDGSADEGADGAANADDASLSDAQADDTGVPPPDGPLQTGDAQAPDGATTDGGPCTGAMCNGVCLAAADCTTCTAAPLFCATSGTCVADCAACKGNGAPRPIECYRCDANRLNPIGTCEPKDPNVYCLNGSAYGTALHCACSAAVPCPGRTEVCTDIGVGQTVCATCGEALSDLHPCVGGGTCSQTKQTCD